MHLYFLCKQRTAPAPLTFSTGALLRVSTLAASACGVEAAPPPPEWPCSPGGLDYPGIHYPQLPHQRSWSLQAHSAVQSGPVWPSLLNGFVHQAFRILKSAQHLTPQPPGLHHPRHTRPYHITCLSMFISLYVCMEKGIQNMLL